MKRTDFVKGTEKLVNPITVGSLHFMQSFNRLLPRPVQKKLVTSSAKKIPYMGFVVEPYAFFLCYEIADIEAAKALLPDGFSLVKTHIFDKDEAKYYGIIGCFRSHTSAFWGTRAECYVIAEDQNTGLLSWIIVDYDSDTISYDSQSGLKSPSCEHAVHTTDYTGALHVDIARTDATRRLAFSADVAQSPMQPLDQRLWLEGNLSIGYGRVLSKNNADLFSLKFMPGEVEQALRIPANKLQLEENSWYPGLFKPQPETLVCFPYAQHFVSDSPGTSHNPKNKDELIEMVRQLDFGHMNVFSAKLFVRMLVLNGVISATITIALIVALILK